MKKWITILAVILVAVFAAGCTSSSGPKTYNSNGISFQYPGDWSTDYKSDIQESLGNSANVSVSLGKDDAGMAVANAEMGSVNVPLDTLASAFKSGLQSGGFTISSEKTRTVDGSTAKEFVIKDNQSGLYGSFTLFKKNNDIYFIMIATPDNNQQTVDMILNSFKVQ